MISIRINKVVLALVLAAYWYSAAEAQNASSAACDVPVVVADYNNQPVRRLVPSDFTVRVAGAPSSVKAASVDTGSKRVAIVLDASSSVPEEEWKLETEMAPELLSHARQGDQFLLLVVGSGPASSPFSSSTDVVARIRTLTTTTRNNSATEKIYDALLDAAHHFDPPQFGDTIFLFGHYRDAGSTASFDTLHNLVLRKGLRFLAISFEDRFVELPRRPDPNKPVKNFHLAPLESLSDDSGYYFSYHAVHNLAYPGQIPLFRNFLSDLYTWIAEPYRVQIPAPPKERGLEIFVTEMRSRKISQRGVHFPHFLYECVDQPARVSATEQAASVQ